ncbi:MAG: twin-arginine translocase TatA/TatE family subunit [Kiritimatiellae bacterium]|nr:twin-arginine translocase TatA/TatE family subunit [Kiritimatiellia bacterium]MDW8458567.1 twin-arginine translocase TatA/TatE family subunit [Verrucomicrobiota bacterium]
MECMVAYAFFGGSAGGGEVLLILVVALILFGSKNLPEIARTIGRTLEQIRRTANEVRDEVMKAGLDEPPAGTGPEDRPRSLPQPRPPAEDGDERVPR